MICVGMSKQMLKKLPVFSGYFNIFCTEAELYIQAYDISTNIIVLTDDFIKNVIGWDRLVRIVEALNQNKSNLTIMLLGKKLDILVRNTIPIYMDWQLPQRVNRVIEKLHSYKKNTISNEFDNTFNDLSINLGDVASFSSYIMKYPEKSIKVLREVFNKFNNSSNELLAKDNQISTLLLEAKTTQNLLDEKRNELDEIYKMYHQILYIHQTLVYKINKQYGIAYEDDNSLGYRVNNSTYTNILYLKELSNVRFTTSLFYYLQTILNSLNISHTRAIIIEKPGNFSSQLRYRDYILTSQMNIGNLKSSDLLMIGYQKDIMLAILQNVVFNKYLLILDRSGADNEFLSGSKIQSVYLMNDIEDNKIYRKPIDRIISYSKKTMHIPYVEDFNKLDSTNKLSKYSEFKIINNLLKIIEREE